MSKSIKRLFVLFVLVLPLALSAIACDDNGPVDVPGINDTGDAMVEVVDDGADTLNTLWCLGDVNDWEIRCGGDGVKPQ